MLAQAITAKEAAPAVQGKFWRPLIRYGLCIAALAIPSGIAILLAGHPALGPVVSVSFIAVISAAAWWAGAWAGILVSCASVPVLTLIGTAGKSAIPPRLDYAGMAVLFFISILVSRVAHTRRHVEQVLRTANEQLDYKVRERTAELNASHHLLEHRLAEIENVYRAAPVGLAFFDRDLRYLRVNEAMASFHNQPIEAHAGRCLRDIVPAPLPDLVEPICRGVLKGGESVLNWEYPLHGTEQPGDQHWSLSFTPVKAPSGSVLGLQVVAADTTERRRAEEALRESEARFRLMANSAPVMIWLTDADRLCTWVNRRWLEFTGRELEQETGYGWADMIHPEDRAAVISTLSKAFEAREPFVSEFRLRRQDGEWRWALNHGIPRFGREGEFVGFIGSCVDIHDRKAVEENLRRANADLEQFAYSASHDLKEPLRIVAVYSQILARRYQGSLDERAQQALTYVISGAKRMDSLVRDLLAYTQSGEKGEVGEPASAAEALESAVSGLSLAIAESGGAVTSGDLPRLRVLKIHIQQLFQKLIGNAIKYRSEQPPRIHVGAEPQAGFWRFSVQDNGIGIDPAYKERIFGIFKRLHTADQYSGTGIGLAICKRIVERYQGRIWVESQSGAGSTFYFELPG